MIEVKNITEPQRIYIFGSDFEDKQQTFSTTDDYDTVDLYLYKDNKRIDTMDICGHCFIYTEEEYQENKDAIDEDGAGGVDVVILEDFVGKISIDVRFTNFDTETLVSSIVSDSLLKEDANINEYLKYETDLDNHDSRYKKYALDCILFIDGTYSNVKQEVVEEFLEL